MKIKVRYGLTIMVFLLVLNACATGEITDLINEETDSFSMTKEYNWNDTDLDDYSINGVLFIPYMNQVFENENDQSFSVYSLKLAVYKDNNNDSSVVVDSVSIIGDEEVKIEPKTILINKEILFKEYDDNLNVLVNDDVLLDAINDADLELNDKSIVQVILNVTITHNGINENAELAYEFKTHTRKYLKQR